MSKKESDPPLTISEASHRVPCTVRFLRRNVRAGHINEHRLPTGHLIFYRKEIEQARMLMYGDTKKRKPNGR